jgi:2-polyprenyl-6-methoxyphenol hydroxylase-like FAD-dependent oxidoreductase
MLAGELALVGVDIAIVERRANHELVGSRAGGLHSRTIEILDQRGIADRFLSQGRWPRSPDLPGSAWTSAIFPPGTTIGSRCGKTTSSASGRLGRGARRGLVLRPRRPC